MPIPAEIVDWFRSVFAAANRRLSERMLNTPAIPEPSLDLTLIEHLLGYSTPRAFPSGWAVRIDTHYLGGLRHYRSWEVADIGVFVFFQRRGTLIRQKVALLQSKRLFPATGGIDHLEEYDFRIGMARLGRRDKHSASMMSQRQFTFSPSSRYQALMAHDAQYIAINDFVQQRRIPVYYLLYNPPRVPLRVRVPLTEYIPISADPPLGARVMPYDDVAAVLQSRKPNYKPSLADLAGKKKLETYGWRFEHFMADLLLSCRVGRRFADPDEEDMAALFVRRSGPIAAAVAVTVEIPKDAKLPE